MVSLLLTLVLNRVMATFFPGLGLGKVKLVRRLVEVSGGRLREH